MTKEYFVLDGENNTVWIGRDEDDKPQVFKTFAAAEKKAKEFAETAPGENIKIVSVEAVVACDVAKPKTRQVR
jgi:hypothetical protein